MWQEQFDYFWDGRRRLVIGAFEGADRGPAPSARPSLTVVSAREPGFGAEPTLVDVIDPLRWRAGMVVADIPADHRFVRLSAGDGAELTLHLGSGSDQPPGGEYRLLLTLLPENNGTEQVVFRLVSLSARGEIERLAREQTSGAGARLVWAIGQRRAFEQGADGGLVARLAPARRIFPAYQSRLLLEPCPLDTEASADTREAPFAIMEHWLRENGAPRATLRLRIPDSLEESATLLGRACVAMALNQRRRLRGWMNEQKQSGEPVIDPLTFDDIRQATGEPAEYPDAVEVADTLVVANLLGLILDPDDPEADGVAVRRIGEKHATGLGETIEIDFYGAALGDDVGLVAPTAGLGDIGVAPADPGGPPYARLFRIEGDGLTPRRLAEEDPLLEDLMRRAASVAGRANSGAAARAFAERAAGLKGRREKLVAALNESLTRAGAPARLSAAGIWDVFEPLQQASFAAIAAEAPASARALLQDAGGYGAFGADPSLASALACGGPLAQSARSLRFDPRAGTSLLARYAAACGAEGMAPPGLDAAAQFAALRALMQEEDALALRDARIGVSPDPAVRRLAAAAARQLADVGAVERAIAHFEQYNDDEGASALEEYLGARRAGRWVAAQSAPALAALIARAGVEREEQQTRVAAGMTAAAAAPPPPAPEPEKPRGFFRRIFGG
ncbi:MAG: hypothetical protein CTY15_08805 [Methylocystis sp.]|nr:MAG: hypothetical protein CTY15_08805 [Methylocystis sp.]